MIDRRNFLALGLPLAAYALVGSGGAAAQAATPVFGPRVPFSFEGLRARAAAMARGDLLMAMVENPVLIERPIVVNGDKVALGRPPEAVLHIL